MMSPLAAPILGGLIALIVTVAISAVVNKRRQENGSWKPSWKNSLGLICGLGAGFLILALMAKKFVPGDRFYTVSEALPILAATSAGCGLIWLVEVFFPKSRNGFGGRALAHLAAQIIASALLVWAGVRFELMKVPGEGVATLSMWQSHLWTVVWLITATNIIRLFDGIHGAASVAVLVAGVTALFSNMVYDEFLLTGVSLVAMGGAGGVMWYCASKQRIPLEGSGTAILGFLFAALTVLARQKTVASVLLLIPLVLVILVAGAAILGLLEKRLVLPKDEKHE